MCNHDSSNIINVSDLLTHVLCILSSKIAHGARSGRSITRKSTTITMELYGIPPPTIDWSGSHLPEAWKNLKQHLNLFFRRSSERKDGRGKRLKTPAVGVGDKGRDIYNTFPAFFCRGKEKVETTLGQIPNSCATKIKPNFIQI